MATAVGAVLIGVAWLMWWSAEQAVSSAPEVQWSSEGGMSQCLGDQSCVPQVISGQTVTLVVILAGVGVALMAAVLVEVVLRRWTSPATTE
ncbi:hypothetical protein [Lentzea cavernae]|uniref:hypothetical protein n=1 Tax=Lentzea cavernae TaxID=2020703 RepID=UPI00174DAD68|nr:hypothetical protein [Lentzea cavernae]